MTSVGTDVDVTLAALSVVGALVLAPEPAFMVEVPDGALLVDCGGLDALGAGGGCCVEPD